jgi:hypothetical protein
LNSYQPTDSEEPTMTAVGYDTREEEGWDEELPRRPRRQFFNRRTAALAALITCALGFYGGVRVEKGQLASSTSTSAGAGSALPAGLRAGAGAAGATGRPGAAGAATGRPGGGNVSFGTVKSIDGKTIDVSDSSGNTVKVTLSPVAKITKSQKVSKQSVRPGDTVVIQGVKGSSGTLTATSVSDSGASASGPAGGSTAGGSSRSGSSAVGSLFGAGG